MACNCKAFAPSGDCCCCTASCCSSPTDPRLGGEGKQGVWGAAAPKVWRGEGGGGGGRGGGGRVSGEARCGGFGGGSRQGLEAEGLQEVWGAAAPPRLREIWGEGEDGRGEGLEFREGAGLRGEGEAGRI